MKIRTAVTVAALVYLSGREGKILLHVARGRPIMRGITVQDGTVYLGTDHTILNTCTITQTTRECAHCEGPVEPLGPCVYMSANDTNAGAAREFDDDWITGAPSRPSAPTSPHTEEADR